MSIWDRVEIGEPEKCWPAKGRLTSSGYKQIMHEGVRHQAHRLIYQVSVGEIPEGMVVDHKCHNLDLNCLGGPCHHRACCNPSHLEAVTQRQNMHRSQRHKANRTHCPQNHEYTPENTRIGKNGGRYCRACCNKWPR